MVVTSPALVQRLLSPSLNLPKDPAIYHVFSGLTSPDFMPNLLGHVTQDGYWRLVRKGIAPAFSPRAIRAEFGHVLSLADEVAAILRGAGSGGFVDVGALLQRHAMDVIARVGFSADVGALRGFGAGGSAVLGSGDVFAELKAAAEEIVALWNRPYRYALRRVLPVRELAWWSGAEVAERKGHGRSCRARRAASPLTRHPLLHRTHGVASVRCGRPKRGCGGCWPRSGRGGLCPRPIPPWRHTC